jgi:hypothetical protein
MRDLFSVGESAVKSLVGHGRDGDNKETIPFSLLEKHSFLIASHFGYRSRAAWSC